MLGAADRSYKPALELEGHEGYVSKLQFWGEENVVTGSGDGTAIVWDIEKQCRAVHYKHHTADIETIAIAGAMRDPSNTNRTSFVVPPSSLSLTLSASPYTCFSENKQSNTFLQNT